MKPEEAAQNAVLAGLSGPLCASSRPAGHPIPSERTYHIPCCCPPASTRNLPIAQKILLLMATTRPLTALNHGKPARDWLARRFHITPEIYGAPHQVLPATGTREALFLAAQIAPDGSNKNLWRCQTLFTSFMPPPHFQLGGLFI